MRNRVIIVTFISLLMMSCKNNSNMNNNPLLGNWDTPFSTPPFDKIENEHYVPAFNIIIKEAYKEIDEIASCKDAPTFENTILPFEYSGNDLGRLSRVINCLSGANTNDTLQNILMELYPRFVEFENYVSLNEKLFQRVKSVYENMDSLPEEDKVLTKLHYKSFARRGANLKEEDKDRFREVSSEMSKLSLLFDQNLLAATNSFKLHITNEADLVGLPDFVREMGAAEAKAASLEGWVYNLQAPSMIPFMQYSEKRDLREKLWKAYNSLCFSSEEYNNQEIVKNLANFRFEMAQLLGYESYADYILEERMAKNTDGVMNFLNEILDKSKGFAQKDIKEISNFAKKNGFDKEFMPWDFSFYSEKYKKEKYDLDDEQLKPYFKLENLQEGIFSLVNKLYGLTFKENKSISVYNQDVKVFEVYDGDRFMSLLYIDYFPRSNKSGGAWMNSFRSQYVCASTEVRPLVTVVTNFTKPTENTPSLLTFDEVTTLLHEFGHALHGILSDGKYPSITGTSVTWDFVELPSQIMENWATEEGFLNMWAKHYQTGEVIPEELVKKIIDSKNYLSGYYSMRQISLGLNDMAWHTIKEPVTTSVIEFERKATELCKTLPEVEGTCRSTSFSHIFAGGYSAGYYSYKWAEVLEADAFSLFKEKGIFNTEVASSFRENILSKGNSKEAMELYVSFRGHKPQIDALFEKLDIK